jgi:hypothetical protein
MKDNPFVGTWTYRSLLNEPDVTTDFDKLEFGRGTIVISAPSSTTLGGTIGAPAWSLDLHGSIGYGSAIVGSVVRTIPHSGSSPGTISPAGVVASFYAVWVG